MLVVVRGDHRLNEIKLQNALRRARSGRRRPRRCESDFGARARASSGPSARRCRCWPTRRCAASRGLVAGAQRAGHAPARASSPGATSSPSGSTCAAWRPATATRRAATIRIEPAIEVGNIFKLGTRYSEPLGARYLDEDGQGAADLDGLVRHRARRASSRRRSSSSPTTQGISWPRAVAPFDVELVTLGKPGEEARALSDQLYDELREPRPRRALRRPRRRAPGEKFADAELLGCPLRVTIGKQERRGRARSRSRCGAARRRARCRSRAPPRRPRSCGGPSPDVPAARRPRPLRGPAAARRAEAQPLNPWTIPNAIGFARLALVPVFLVVALSSGDGHSGLAVRAVRLHRVERLLRRHGRPRHRPVQPARRAARPAHRPPARGVRRASWPGTTRRCRAGRWRCWPRASCSCSCSRSSRCGAGIDLNVIDAGPLGGLAGDERAGARAAGRTAGSWTSCCTSGSR